MNTKNIFISIVSIVITVCFLWLVYVVSNQPAPDQKPISELQTLKNSDHVKWGGKSASTILVEFSDLQCPACKSFHDVLKTYEASGSAKSKTAQKIAFAYRHYPLTQVHKNATNAAYAAEAAGRQGKFFEMADLMFDNQSTWENENNPTQIFTDFAKQLNLDITRFQKDISSSSDIKNKINEDIASGNRAGVNATPTFYLNGKKMNITTIDDFEKQLENAVKKTP